MNSLKMLQDQILMEAYYNALHLNLADDFIDLLFEEISRRNLLTI